MIWKPQVINIKNYIEQDILHLCEWGFCRNISRNNLFVSAFVSTKVFLSAEQRIELVALKFFKGEMVLVGYCGVALWFDDEEYVKNIDFCRMLYLFLVGEQYGPGNHVTCFKF